MQQEIQKIWAEKARRGDFLSFAKLVKPNYKVTKFNQYLAWKLQNFVMEVEQGKDPFLVISVEPRSGKSELSSRLLPAWTLGLYPSWEIIVASYGADLAGDFVGDAKGYIKHENYPFDTRVKFGDDRAYDFETNLKGKYRGSGVGGGITGKGANILILDDLFKGWKEAESELQRENVWQWYLSTLRTRKTPGKSGILVVSTRWHEDDLIGKLIAKAKSDPNADQPEIIKFPAIAQEDEWLEGANGRFLFRSKDEVLQPERKSLKEVLKDKASVEHGTWESLYMQDPAPPKGYIIQEDWFLDFTMNEIPNDLPVFSYSDTAYGVGKDNSVTVYGFIYNYTAYICHVEVGDYKIDQFLMRNYVEIANSPRNRLLLGCDNPEPFCDYRAFHLIEPKASGSSAIQLAKRYNVAADKTKELSDSKVVRVKSITGVLKAGRVRVLKGASWRSSFLARCAKFSDTAKFKDEADALAGFIRNFLVDYKEAEIKSETVMNEFVTDAYYGDSGSTEFYE
jgi:hypothetical protein